MSKKKARKNSEQGTYALCITAGLIIGFGLGAIIGSVLISTLVGAAIGGSAAYLLNQRNRKQR